MTEVKFRSKLFHCLQRAHLVGGKEEEDEDDDEGGGGIGGLLFIIYYIERTSEAH